MIDTHSYTIYCPEFATELAYTSYCSAVGGVAVNGVPLPNWDEFSNDVNKLKQSNAWRVAIYSVMDNLGMLHYSYKEYFEELTSNKKL